MTMTKLFYRFSKLHKLSDFFNVFFVASLVVCFSFRIYAERFNNRYGFGYVIRRSFGAGVGLVHKAFGSSGY